MPTDPMTATLTENPPPSRRLSPDERRSQLVSVGLELLKTTPLDGVTAPAVARAAGVSKGLVFHYFPTQGELRAEIAGAAADELLEMFTSIDRHLDYEGQVRAGIEGFISYIEQQPESYAAIATDAGADDALRTVFERTRDAIVVIVSGAVGRPDPTPAMRLYLRGWIAMAEELTVQWVLHRGVTHGELVDYLLSSAFDAAARGVATRAEPPAH